MKTFSLFYFLSKNQYSFWNTEKEARIFFFWYKKDEKKIDILLIYIPLKMGAPSLVLYFIFPFSWFFPRFFFLLLETKAIEKRICYRSFWQLPFFRAFPPSYSFLSSFLPILFYLPSSLIPSFSSSLSPLLLPLLVLLLFLLFFSFLFSFAFFFVFFLSRFFFQRSSVHSLPVLC
jgi:hypothetical protein